VAAAGLGLGGIAVMVFVMLKVVRGMDQHPYASVAPALGALLGVMLLGLDATVRVGMLDAQAVCFLCLVVSVLGGGLAQRGRGLTALLGIVVATLPSQLVLLSIWAQSGFSHDVIAVLHKLSAADRTFVAVLTVAGVLLSVVAVVARSIASPTSQTQLEEPLAGPGAASGSTPVPQSPGDIRERLARAMSLAIADLNRGDLRPKPQHFSEWNFQDTDVERDDQPRPPSKSYGLLVGSLVVLVSVMLGTAWALARN
jgi:hypothetical protein